MDMINKQAAMIVWLDIGATKNSQRRNEILWKTTEADSDASLIYEKIFLWPHRSYIL